jgi:hypothetical protein
MTVRILDLPKQERPRERLWRHGAASLSTVELLALVLRQGCTGQSAVELAAALLAEHGSLADLAGTAPEELSAHVGMGPAKTAALLAALRLGRCLDAGEAPLTRVSWGKHGACWRSRRRWRRSGACGELIRLGRDETQLDGEARSVNLPAHASGFTDRTAVSSRVPSP